MPYFEKGEGVTCPEIGSDEIDATLNIVDTDYGNRTEKILSFEEIVFNPIYNDMNMPMLINVGGQDKIYVGICTHPMS